MERNDKLKRLEYWIKARIGKIAFIDVEEKRAKEWYGNGYGGFYVDPSLVPENAIVYSFGIGEDISFDKAREQATAYGHSLDRELKFLFVHGLLHLLGYDHMTEDDENIMFSLQEEILA